MEYIEHSTEKEFIIKILKDKKLKAKPIFGVVFFSPVRKDIVDLGAGHEFAIRFKLKDIIKKYKYYVYSPQYNYSFFRNSARLSPRLYNLIKKVPTTKKQSDYDSRNELCDVIKNDKKMPNNIKNIIFSNFIDSLKWFIGEPNRTFEEVFEDAFEDCPNDERGYGGEFMIFDDVDFSNIKFEIIHYDIVNEDNLPLVLSNQQIDDLIKNSKDYTQKYSKYKQKYMKLKHNL